MNEQRGFKQCFAVCVASALQTVFIVKGRTIDTLPNDGLRVQFESGITVDGANCGLMASENVCDTMEQARKRAQKMAQKYGARQIIVKEKM